MPPLDKLLRIVGGLAFIALAAAPGQTETARLSDIAAFTHEGSTGLRLSANGPIVWRELSGVPPLTVVPPPLRVRLFGVTQGTVPSAQRTALGQLTLTAVGASDLILTLTSEGVAGYRIHSGRAAHIVEIEMQR
jgi:hypothetical protein